MKTTPASLRSDLRPLCPGLPGRFALDWVAGLTGIRSNLAKAHAADGQPIVYVHIWKLKPLRSRIEKLELKRVA